MKKLLLILSIFVVTFSAFAAELNPFAYGLRSSVNATNPMRLDIEYKLNAPATSVKVYLYDVDKTWEQEVTVQELLPEKLDDHRTAYSYTGWIDLTVIPGHLRGGENNINWRVDVNTGKARENAEFVYNGVKLDFPSSIDIDNNPENENFGTVFVVEALPTGIDKDKFISNTDGAGLYIVNADATIRPMPNRPAGRYGYNGSRVKQTRQYFNGTSSSGFSPYRVRVSDDGRIFVSSMTPDGHVLWEANPLMISRPDDPNWETWATEGWQSVISVNNANTAMATTRRNCSHTDCGIYGLYVGNATNGKFMAGPNLGFDVRGAGPNLKLLMLSGCKEAIVHFTSAHFYCSEYDLGTSKIWNTEPSRRIFSGHVVNYAGVQVQYDGDGNVWMCQHRNSADAATLLKFDATSTDVYKELDNPKQPFRRCGAIRFNDDYTQVAIASIGSGTGGAFTVYPVVDGLPVWEQGTEVNCKSVTHHSLMDFAWDYADNLYIAADEADGTAGNCVAVYAMPHSGFSSTPAASGYAFEVNCASDESYLINVTAGENQGSATITAGFDAEGKVPSCTPVEVFAQSKDGYKFVCWKEGDVEVSRENPYTFSAVKDVTLTAHFEKGEYNVTWWNLFKNNEDIAKESSTTPNSNERLWRLYQVHFNEYATEIVKSVTRKDKAWVGSDDKTREQYKEFDIAGFFASYLSDDQKNNGYITRNAAHEQYLMATETLRKTEKTDATTPFVWLRKYVEYVNGVEIKAGITGSSLANRWAYALYHFFNRTNTERNSSAATTTLAGLDANHKSFEVYGQSEYWRPWWTDGACNLSKTMGGKTFMPTTWNKIEIKCTNYTITSDAARPDSYAIEDVPITNWYQWYTAPKSDQLLAWRDGGTTGRIVHHVYRDNMKLYATYVDAHLQENDPQPDLSKNPYDATNNDVLDLLANENHGTTGHNITIDRKFVAGMYNTVCFPFDLHRSLFPTKLKDAEVLTFDGVTVTGNEYGEPVAVLNFITLEEYWQKWNEEHPDSQVDLEDPYMEAGVPYLIKPKTDISDDYLTYSGLKYWKFFDSSRTPNANKVGSVSFHGVLNPTDLPENAYILVANNRLAKVTDGNEKMKGFRGYFTWDDPVRMPPAKISISVGKQVTTDVEEIVDDQIIQPDAPKVRKVMYDGQIYILRGDEVYTITGHRVK